MYVSRCAPRSRCVLHEDSRWYRADPLSVQHILDLNVSGKLTAFSDTWPDYTWRLHGQFYPKEYPAEYEAMKKQNYNLEIDYFMSTVMYYDTRAVLPHPVPLRETTVALLYALAREFPHCNGDQYVSWRFVHPRSSSDIVAVLCE
eukprot:m.380520 g.380520  ORF g.380520 m.380520 type:complete len:145 (-) comp20957_c2_seq101:79-513(-)